MTEIQCTNISFAQRTIDDLVSRDKPFTLSLSPGDTGSLHHIAIQSDHLHSDFVMSLAKSTYQRVINGTGILLDVTDKNADALYHMLSAYTAKSTHSVFVGNLGLSEVTK